MPKSNINQNFEYDETTWVISLINTGSKWGGHAVLVVEGLESNGKKFIGEYDITASSFGDESFFQSLFNNSQGVITKIRCNPSPSNRKSPESPTAKFYRNYEIYSDKKSWHANKIDVFRVIEAIETDSLILEQAIKQAAETRTNVEWPFRYQRAGRWRLSVLGGNGGDNCASYLESKLAIANLGNGQLITDSIKAIPSLHTAKKTDTSFC